jgi:lipid-A-disaccharide synthase
MPDMSPADGTSATPETPLVPGPLFALVAGEASGDQLGADLIHGLRLQFPGARFIGMTGPRMRAAGCESLADIEALNVMGLVEILRHYPRLRRLRARVTREILAARPVAMIGIDVPDFTLWMEAHCKAVGILAVHYVCPQVWAWRERRIPRIGRAVNHVLTLFPFEAPFLAGHGIEATFVGHPLADRIPPAPRREELRRALGLPLDHQIVALMPGSRRQELVRHVDLFLRAAHALHARLPGTMFVAGAVHADAAARLRARQAALVPELPLVVIERRASEVLMAADAALVVSGTISLESALSGTPAVVAYRLAPLSYWWLKRLVRVAHVALPNLLLGRRLFPEFLQDAATPEALANALGAWLTDAQASRECREACASLHGALAHGAGETAARAIERALARSQSKSPC